MRDERVAVEQPRKGGKTLALIEAERDYWKQRAAGSEHDLDVLLAASFAAEDLPKPDQITRETDDRPIDRALALLLLRHGGQVEFTDIEMTEAPQHGEFFVFRNPGAFSQTLKFVPSDTSMAEVEGCHPNGDPIWSEQ
jgi:hypothetical protein